MYSPSSFLKEANWSYITHKSPIVQRAKVGMFLTGEEKRNSTPSLMSF